jgi:2-oxoglutarate dehydrogenase E2 component (dihydrolipoamide succinyltransferase)
MRPESVVVLMPQMGESLAEGTLVRWLKQAGDTVRLDEPLFEISTDKVDTEVPSSVEGVLAEILVAEGRTVAVGTVLATIEPSATGAAAITEPGGRAEDDRPRSNPQASDGHFKSDRPPQLIVRRREPPAETSVEAHRAASILTPAVLDAARRGSLPLDSLVSIEGSGRGLISSRRVSLHAA